MKTRFLRQRGVTLIELVISIVVMGIAMAALMQAFSISINQSGDPLWRNKTLKLAQLYLDEIIAKNYDHATPVGGLPVEASPGCSAADLGPEGAEDRESYNDVDDYDGYSESPPTGVTDVDLSGYAGYTVSIEVECDGDSVAAENTAGTVSDNHAKLITVSITTPYNDTLSLSAYKGNF